MTALYLFKGHKEYNLMVNPYVANYMHVTFRMDEKMMLADGTPNSIKKFIKNLLIAEGKEELYDLIYLEVGDDVLRFGGE